jgi:hypothetical protein
MNQSRNWSSWPSRFVAIATGTAASFAVIAAASLPAEAVTPASPEVDCTFTVNGHYRALDPVTPAFLEQIGVPASAVGTVLDNFAAVARDMPADWNVHCTGVNTGPFTTSTVGGHPSASDPYIACQMNTTTPTSDSSYSITTSLLQTFGVPPSSWTTVINDLGQLATKVPPAWGVACSEVTPT